MTAKVSSYRDILYFREYMNDLSLPEGDQMKRVAMATIPFFAMHSSLR
jgi:hypothetical protein